jgi:hypothetical protein
LARRTFNPNDVQELVPALELIWGQLTLLQEDIADARERLAAAKVEGPHGRSDADLETETAELTALSARLRDKLELSQRLVARVQELGGDIKDLQKGLVDFAWRRNGQTVCLCWQYGEKRITHWHTVEEGFGGRKPIEGPVATAPQLFMN